ncbi:energy transducer TonB [Corallococcus carmarthensis]|uniref:Energy transducer TonB n=1 Tax=Corallococcus carmarthensis TaxID=2316728 RepID=A0A3A8K0T5_9BACT|nr:energy transducer TonB [Corallococcus carmarthensis]RKG95443.1 energy transducer TonB [Corallococcus carmarthensis]
MFETFDSASSAPAARRFALSTTASVAVFGLIAVAAMTAANTVKEVIKDKKVDVVFRPPPPRAAPPVAKAAPPPAVPTVAPAPLKAPDAVPLEKPPEAEKEVVAAAPMAVGGTGTLVPGGVVGGTGSGEGMAIGGGRAQPINLPETGTPPEPLSANLIPEYPSDARSKGLEGLVILKGVVEADGRVTSLKVMRGDEPFASAALAAVRTWRFKPAVVSGQPTAVFRIFKVPFRLKS